MILNLAWLIITYVLCSVPFGVFITRAVCGLDPREHGSRNIGATNVARLCGKRYGVAVLALDLLKGFFCVWVATAFNDGWLYLSLCALAAVLGHMYSCFLSGRGGKGFATTIGAFLALAPLTTVLSVALCIAVIVLSGYVSLGALMFGAALPVLLLLGGNAAFVPVALVATLFLYWKHRDNIERLARGQENPWRRKKDGSEAQGEPGGPEAE